MHRFKCVGGKMLMLSDGKNDAWVDGRDVC